MVVLIATLSAVVPWVLLTVSAALNVYYYVVDKPKWVERTRSARETTANLIDIMYEDYQQKLSDDANTHE